MDDGDHCCYKQKDDLKEKALEKLLKVISEAADKIIDGSTCQHRKEAVEVAIINHAASRIWLITEGEMEYQLPKPKALKKRAVGGRT